MDESLGPDSKITVYLTPSEIRFIEEYAREEDRTVSAIMRRWVRPQIARLMVARDRKKGAGA